MEPRHRGPRRHAGAYQDHADGDLSAHPGPEGRTRAGNVAGDLPDRASRTSAPARDRAAVCGRYPLKKQNRPRSDPRPAWCISLVRAAPPPQNCQFVLMSTSLVSGRKKKPTTAVIDAKMIGYQRPA